MDQKCFKWSILARHVTGAAVCRVGENYTQHEEKYNFEGISFPTPLSDIAKFEKNNNYVSVNVYGLEKKFQPPLKYPTYNVYPLRLSDEEKANHFDLLLVADDNGSHYIYIYLIFPGSYVHKKRGIRRESFFVRDASRVLMIDCANTSQVERTR